MSPFELFERGPNWQPREIWSHNRGGRSGLVRCGGCRQVWWQSGEYTSHCSGCHLTFTGLAAFDTHHRAVDNAKGFKCADPATMVDDDSSPRFETVSDDHYGATVTRLWRLIDLQHRARTGENAGEVVR